MAGSPSNRVEGRRCEDALSKWLRAERWQCADLRRAFSIRMWYNALVSVQAVFSYTSVDGYELKRRFTGSV
jgi:hypothetical protein